MKKNGLISKIALLFSGAAFNINVVTFSVAIGVIAANFKDATSSQISQIINLPAIFMIPALYVGAKLAVYISKKYILMGAWVIFLATGVVYPMCTSISQLLVVRAITGFSIGLMGSIPKSMVAQLYPDEINQLNGLQQSCVTTVSFICSICAGLLCAYGWQYPIYLYFIGVIFLILIALFVPAVPPEKAEYEKEKVKVQYTKQIVGLIIAGSFLHMLFCPIQTKLSLMVIQSGMGDSALGGNLRAALTLGSVIGGFVFAAVAKKSTKGAIVLGLGLATIGYYFVATTQSTLIMFIACFVAGMASLGMILPWFTASLSKTVGKEQITMLMSTFSICNYLSQFISTYFIALTEKIAGNGSQAASVYGVAICLGVCFIIACILCFVPKKDTKLNA